MDFFCNDLVRHMKNIPTGPSGQQGPSGGDHTLIAALMVDAKDKARDFQRDFLGARFIVDDQGKTMIREPVTGPILPMIDGPCAGDF